MRDAASQPDGTLRILMVAARYFPFMGGTETHVHEVGTRLAAAGHAVTVLTGNPGGALPAEERIGGVRIVRKRAYPRGRDWCLAPGILADVAGAEGAGSDVVHIQGYHTFAAPFAMLGSLRRSVPYVITFHSGGHSSAARRALRGPQATLLAPLAARAAQLIGVSEFEADHFSGAMGIARDRFVVVPNGAQLPQPAAGAAPDPDAPLVISLGRLERYKGHHRALAAFAHLRERVPGARLRLLGDGPYEGALRAMAERLGIADAVEIGGIPATDRTAMATLLARASLVVLLSDYEAHPVAVMEALALGRPVVVTDVAGCGELARRGLVRAVGLEAAPEATADAMAQELSRGPRPPLPLPDWDTCAARLLAVYRNALDRQRRVRSGLGLAEEGAVL
jgi:glycogen synthase